MTELFAEPILVVIRQVGTANCLIPILRKMNRVMILATSETSPLLQNAGLHVTPFSDFFSVQNLISSSKVSLLLTGTSEHAEDDGRFWTWAKQNGVRSIAVVDRTVHLKARFPLVNSQYQLPEYLLFFSKEEANIGTTLLGKEFSAVIVPNPSLEETRRLVSEAKSYLAPAKIHTALLVTEPNSVGTDESFREEHGLTEEDSMLLAASAFRTASKKTSEAWRLVVRLHPRDNQQRVEKILLRVLKTGEFSWSNQGRIEDLARTQLVLGMRSMFLTEAHACSIPVISFQPNRKTKDPRLEGVSGIRLVVDPKEAAQTLEDAFKEISKNRFPLDNEKIPASSLFIRQLQEICKK